MSHMWANSCSRACSEATVFRRTFGMETHGESIAAYRCLGGFDETDS
jgi:hypothetical protein